MMDLIAEDIPADQSSCGHERERHDVERALSIAQNPSLERQPRREHEQQCDQVRLLRDGGDEMPHEKSRAELERRDGRFRQTQAREHAQKSEDDEQRADPGDRSGRFLR